MPSMTLTYTANEVRELVSKMLSTHGRKVEPDDISFVISRGFPESKDPREHREPSFDSMTVRIKTI